MKLSLYTWNSQAINDGTYLKAWIPPGQLMNLTANGITVPRAYDFPALSGTVLTAHAFVINLTIVPGNAINTYRETIKTYFDITDQQRHNLIAKDTNDSDRQWYLTGFPVRVVEIEPNSFAITFQTEMPVWRLVTAVTDSWAITATGQTKAVTNIGNMKSKPMYTFIPTTANSSGLQYRRWVSVYNNLDVAYNGAFDITGGGLDTAALTTAKMQADGDDLRVWLDGVEVDRWLSAMDSANTLVWCNLSFAPKQEGTTSVNIAGSGAVSTISFSDSRANRSFLQAMATKINKIVLIDNEAFSYTGVNLVTMQLTGCTRARKGTSDAAHNAPKTARWIEHDLWICYGDAALTAPETDDDFKPVFDLASTNTSHVYGSNFYDNTAPNRPGSWRPEVNASKTQLSYCFTANQNTFANPSTKLGCALMSSPEDTNNIGEVGQLDWVIYNAAGYTNVLYSGKKYAADLDSWPAIMGLQYLQPDAAWFTSQTEAIPGVAQAWTAFGAHNKALGATYSTIRFGIDGALMIGAGAAAMVQFDTVTLTLASANVPTFAVGSELAMNMFNFTLTNSTTGEYLKVKTPCAVSDTLTVDAENKAAYLADGSRINVILSTTREAWLDLKVGANTLQFDDVGTVAITAAVIHRDRTM